MAKKSKSGKTCYVVSVGDEGAVICYIQSGILANRKYLSTPAVSDFAASFSENETAPVYILVDIVDQAYIQSTLPPVSRLNINKLIKKKLERDFDVNDLSAAIYLGRGGEGNKKEWNYLFCSVRNAPPISDWIDAVCELPNPFGGIHLLPLESTELVKELKKSVATDKDKASQWQILVSHNRVGGFRQVVYKNNQVIFTRIAQPVGGQTPDVVAGNIEQETLNTLEYIRRLGYRDEILDIIIIVSKEVKDILETSTMPANSVSVMTPHEISDLLRLNAGEERDRFGDVILAVHFALRKKHTLQLNTPYAKKITSIQSTKVAIRFGAIGLGLAFIAFAVFNIFNMLSINSEIPLAESQKVLASKKVEETKKLLNGIAGNPDVIKDVARLGGVLTKDLLMPLNFFSSYSSVKPDRSLITRLTLQIMLDKTNNKVIDSSFDVEIRAEKGENIDIILDRVSSYTKNIIKQFEGYEVIFEGLPDASRMSLNFQDTNSVRTQNIKLYIKGPKEGQNKK